MSKASPLDFFKPDTEYAPEAVVSERLAVCAGCPSFIKPIKVCKECGCVMPLKTKLANAECPLEKWGKVTDAHH